MTQQLPGIHFRGVSPLLSALLLIIAFAVALAQQPVRKIDRIDFVGLERLAPGEVITASGLKAGTPFSVEAVDAAAQRLADSGLFSKVGYSTRTTGNQVTIVFKVTEAKGTQSPVSFDNFVWFTHDELVAAIKREVPTFNGSAPDAGGMTSAIMNALTHLLQEKQIEGKVEYSLWQAENKQEHLFSVTGVPIRICHLHFPGAKNIPEEKLVNGSKELTDADYSQKSAQAFGTYVLFPFYREVGQLKAKFGLPVARAAENNENCKNGVDLTIPVEEGPVYLWSRAEWTGNEALSADDLNSALGMKPGDVANGAKIDKGVFNVRRTYGRRGHIEAAVQADPVFDDAASRVAFKIAVKEGPQYKMGQLIIKGLYEDERLALEESWKLKNGSVFDAGYVDTFLGVDARDVLEKIFAARQGVGKVPPRIETKFEPKRVNLTADVILEFKY
jgi:outer membrane protein assembly factor BamA